MLSLPRIAIASLALLAGTGAALRAEDVGLCTRVAGSVTFTAGRSAGPVRFMGKIPQGAVCTVPAGAVVQVVFFASARSETWSGPARFACDSRGGRSLAGNPGSRLVVRAVPGASRFRSIELSFHGLGTRRIGASLLRGDKSVPQLPAEARAFCDEARATYEWSARQAPAEDVTAELHYLATLAKYYEYSEAREEAIRVARLALAKQPDNPLFKGALADLEWLQANPRGKTD